MTAYSRRLAVSRSCLATYSRHRRGSRTPIYKDCSSRGWIDVICVSSSQRILSPHLLANFCCRFPAPLNWDKW
jgi:hypothetical protein